MRKLYPNSVIRILILAWCASSGGLYAQSGSFGATYVYSGAEMAIVNVSHNFLSGGNGAMAGIIGTDRVSPQGYLSFVGTASFIGASNTNHVDGYVKTYQSGSFIFPIGDNGIYRPAAVSAASSIAPSDAAYYAVNPSTAITSSLKGGNEPPLPSGGLFSNTANANDVTNVSSREYWDINGTTSAKITLTWELASDVTAITGSSLSRLTIVGWDGTKWVAVPSTVDDISIVGGSSSLNSGSITTNIAIVPDRFTVYTLASTACAIAVPTVASIVQPTCGSSTGSITIASQIGVAYSVDNGTTYQATAVFTGLVPGNYSLAVKSLTDVTCTATAVAAVTLNAVPTAPTTPIATLTQPNYAVATGTILFTSPAIGVLYSIDNGTTYQSSVLFSGVVPATYVLKVRSTSDTTCTSTSSSTVTINRAPLPPTLVAVQNANGTISVSGFAEAGSTVTVTFPDGSIGTAVANSTGSYGPISSILPQANGTIKVKAKDIAGNVSVLTTVPFTVTTCEIEVFNAVSDNGDGINDVLNIRGLECYPDNTVEIYNRWGVLVFERTSYNNDNRAFKGVSEGKVTINQSEELPVGTYFYIFKYKDSNLNAHEKAGYLYLNR